MFEKTETSTPATCLDRYLSGRLRIPIISTAAEVMPCGQWGALLFADEEVAGLSELTQLYSTAWVIIAWVAAHADPRFSGNALI